MSGATHRTLARPVEVDGVGLFTSRPVRVRMLPASPGEGITLRRLDVREAVPIPALIDDLASTPAHPAFASMPARSTSLARGDVRVDTVEHILSALAGMGVTDARIELDAAELPIDDGSGVVFATAIARAETRDLRTPIEPLIPASSVRIEGKGGAFITADPAEVASYTYELDYGPDSPIERQTATWDGSPGTYLREIAPARTFCLLDEATAMKQLGLFQRFSPRDLLVFGPGGPIDNTLRWANEPARHKVLDLIGDLSLVGRPLVARVVAHRSGHSLNHEMARRLREI